MKIDGSVALVTGASRGLGRVHARELVSRGAAQVYGAARDPAAVTEPGVTSMITAKGMRLFAVIDQAAEARQAGLELRETVLVIFGSPQAGTPVMAASPLAALDLPLKVLIWADEGQTKVSYYAPAALAARHHLTADLAASLVGINALTDALVASERPDPGSVKARA
jgi:uncharacterized protein (DUF302 family)